MTRSAGCFWWKHLPHQPSEPIEAGIRLSQPLLAHRPHSDLLATLAHESIHAWVGLHLGELRHGHGPLFQRKLEGINRQTQRFQVTQHHQFTREVASHYKHRWDCLNCGHIYRRQRNTIRPGRHRCGSCGGPLAKARG